VHHITLEELSNEKSFTEAFKDFEAFLTSIASRDHTQTPVKQRSASSPGEPGEPCTRRPDVDVEFVLIAHNAFGFDARMLDHEMARANVTSAYTIHYADTYNYMTTQRRFSRQRLGLEAQYIRAFGCVIPNAHSARGDVKALLRLCKSKYAAEDHEQFFADLLTYKQTQASRALAV